MPEHPSTWPPIWTRGEFKYVTFPRWPEDGTDWIHPNDIKSARKLVPSNRVFVQRKTETDYESYVYGNDSFRAYPRLRKRITGDGLLVGDRVEVRSRLGRRRPVVAVICGMFWDDYHRQIQYRIRYRRLNSELNYGSHEFLRLIPPNLPAIELNHTIDSPAEFDESGADYRILPLE